MNKFYTIILLSTLFGAKSQTILNAYAKVTTISASKTTLTVTNVNEASHTFTVGGKVIIMQMQDDVIGTYTTNASNFGDLATTGIANAGKYEIAIISSRSPASGTPTTITLSSALTNAYNTGANSSVQILTLRSLGTNYTTTSSITGLAWDGNVGGIIAIEVTNTLTLNHNITADVIGFKKGLINSNAVAGACLPTTYITNSVSQAFKGEGIYKATDANFVNARAKILNGGGGGNEHNGGGGGGGNYTAGGAGGFGYSCETTNSGGFGGIALGPYITGDRVFMGGGGGGGQQNNTVGLDGGSGGGIIFIKAQTIATSTVCGSAVRITANGGSTANCGNDGAGGGGGAGTIVLQVNSYSATATCPLTINANGGNGGSVGDGAVHGGGGGGGQGAVIFSSTQPTVNISTAATNGSGGRNSSSGSYANNGEGTNNSGIISLSGPLPIELLYFNGEAEDTKVKLYWATATEKNNDYYTIEKSIDGINFKNIDMIDAIGNSLTTTNYQTYDHNPHAGINYYKLKQTDEDTRFTYSNIVTVTFEKDITFSVFPNPANSNEIIYISFDKINNNSAVELNIYDVTGKLISSQNISSISHEHNVVKINDFELAKGIYMIRLFNGNISETKKLIIH